MHFDYNFYNGFEKLCFQENTFFIQTVYYILTYILYIILRVIFDVNILYSLLVSYVVLRDRDTWSINRIGYLRVTFNFLPHSPNNFLQFALPNPKSTAFKFSSRKLLLGFANFPAIQLAPKLK